VQQLETLLRVALFKPACALVEHLLQSAADRIDAAYRPGPGQVRKGRENVHLQGLFGSLALTRDYYYHEKKKQGFFPTDAALGLEGGYTPMLARLLCLEGADETSYQKAEFHLLETGGIPVSARQIQRLVQGVGKAAHTWQERAAVPERCTAPILYVSADGTGVPMRREELTGKKGRQEDGTAKTRQAYLGCVFTQHGRDKDGHPLRDHESTTYVSCLGPIGDFGPRLRQEAVRRGMGQVPRVVLLIDGAAGLEHMGNDCFNHSLQIVDFYHALEHGGRVLEALLGHKQHPEYERRRRHWAKRLLRNGVEGLVNRARKECAGKANAQAVEKELSYFTDNLDRMRYGTFRAQGLFIGSGVIEAGCKTVIGARCKQSGMFWGGEGAQNILALRCIHASRRMDAFWTDRLANKASLLGRMDLAA